jgi:transcriptional regulator NrdR family protein
MKCPKCGSTLLSCIESRPSAETIRRRRKCLDCGFRFTTFEISTEEYYGLKIKETLVDEASALFDGAKERMKGTAK